MNREHSDLLYTTVFGDYLNSIKQYNMAFSLFKKLKLGSMAHKNKLRHTLPYFGFS